MKSGLTEDPTTCSDSRYGRARLSGKSRRRIAVGLTLLVVAAGIAIALVGYQRLGTGTVAGSLAAYQLIDAETASVTISVTRADPSQPVDCIVRVRAKDGTETGRREVLVPPADQATVQVTTTLKSSKPPVMADVYGCGAQVPSYLRTS